MVADIVGNIVTTLCYAVHTHRCQPLKMHIHSDTKAQCLVAHPEWLQDTMISCPGLPLAMHRSLTEKLPQLGNLSACTVSGSGSWWIKDCAGKSAYSNIPESLKEYMQGKNNVSVVFSSGCSPSACFYASSRTGESYSWKSQVGGFSRVHTLRCCDVLQLMPVSQLTG